MRAAIERVIDAPAERLGALLAESERQGFRFVRRLMEEWESGANRFDRPGEVLFVARVGDEVVGVCGLNVDPHADDPAIGRVRHLYVRVSHRRSGIGEQLVADVLEAARGRFARLHLRTTDLTAARLYERFGFRRTGEGRDRTHVLDVGTPAAALLGQTYAAFNARDVDAVLALMHADVDWPNGMEGGRVHGHRAVREYWTRQWGSIDPRVEPRAFATEADGRIAVDVRQVVRDRAGALLKDEMVQHVYRIEGGLIRSMEIRGEIRPAR